MQKRIRAQQKIKMHARAVEFLLEVPHGIHRIKYLAPGMARAGFRKRWDEARMIGAGDRHHRVAVRVGGHAAAMLVRRMPGGNEMNFVEMKAALGGARHGEMADVNGIEGAAEKRDAALARLLPGNAVCLPAARCSTVLRREAPSRG